ncbi:hypothetical protein GOP47_0008525 [Adiantum capillus-veneris]|uniref:Uncharacterized protein n=1 Tax=Adiantum capillus-veneris TaxID=13818 RepID=A0A9D4UZ55_ADICA|nr:hypothetical protein GOP47_0008525 [Adiantum capillus-veneris]
MLCDLSLIDVLRRGGCYMIADTSNVVLQTKLLALIPFLARSTLIFFCVSLATIAIARKPEAKPRFFLLGAEQSLRHCIRDLSIRAHLHCWQRDHRHRYNTSKQIRLCRSPSSY